MRKRLLAMMLFVAVRTVYAQDTALPSAKPSLNAVPLHGATASSASAPINLYPSSSAAPAPGSYSTDNRNLSPPLPIPKADHLHQVAMHLWAVGLNGEAKKYWLMEAEERAHPTPMVSMKLRIMELSRNKLGKQTSETYGGDKNTSVLDLLTKLQSSDKAPVSKTPPTSSNPKLLSLINSLCKDHLIAVVSESEDCLLPGIFGYRLPRGEAGYFPYGAEEQRKYCDGYLKYLEKSIRIDYVPRLLPRKQIGFDCRIQRCELDYANAVQGDPAFRDLNFETHADIRPGETVVLESGIQRQTAPFDNANTGDASKQAHPFVDEIQTIVVVTAVFVPQK